ncbi:UNVERIFIED_CONTAM: hypothetical protein FKN15_041596 [Acipenser sinensis]
MVHKNTPLHWAVMSGNDNAAHFLLEAGADVDAQNAKGETPLHLAHQVRNPLLIHMLTQVKHERSNANMMFFRRLQRYKFIDRVSGYTVSPGLKLLAVSTQDGAPQYAALVQPPTCRLHEGPALLSDVAYWFFFCFYSSLQFNS